MSTRINVQKFGGHVEVASNLTVDTSTLHVDSMSNRIGVGTVNPYSKMTVLGDILINTGEASWDTGMKNLLGTQDLISAGIASGAGTGSISASTDVDLPLEVVNDVIAKFVNTNATEVITAQVSTGYTPALNDSVQFDLWIYNSSGATISVEFFAFSGGTQSVSFDALSNSTWTRYSPSITIGSGNTGSVLQIRMDNNTSGKTFYFTGLSTRINPSNTTNPVFTPKGFPISGTGTTFSVPNTVAHEASIGSVTITDTTASVSTTTGALKVAGGIGASGDIYANAFKGNADTASQVYVASRDSENATHYPTFTTTEDDGNASIYQDSGLTYNPSSGILATARYYTDDYLTHNGDTDTYIGFPIDDTFTVTTGNVERMRVNSSGNVGIGTTDPGSYKLNVNGSLSATSVTVPNDGDFVMNSKTLVPATGMYWDRVNSKLGIGTTTPLSSFTIRTNYSGGESSGLCLDSTDGSVYNFRLYSFVQSGSNVGWNFRVNNVTSSVDALTLGSTGNVGIGKTDPGYKLDVSGAGRFTGNLTVEGGTVTATTFSGNATTATTATNVSGGTVSATTGTFSDLLTASGGVKSYKDGVVAEFQPATDGGHTLINFHSKVNATSDKGFILVQDESAHSPGTNTEDLRMTIGVYNDFRQSSEYSDELWFQGGGRLVYNVGSWDSELNTIIGTPGVGTTGGHEWRVNDSAKMTLSHAGNLTVSGNVTATGAGIGTTTITSLLTVNAIPFHRDTYDHSEAPLTVTYTATPTSTASIEDPKSVLHLAREGTSGEAYGARASFKLSRYEVSGANSRTRLDLNLAHNYYDDQHIMTFRSDGNVGIGTTGPGYKLEVNGSFKSTGATFTSAVNDNGYQWLECNNDGTWGRFAATARTHGVACYNGIAIGSGGGLVVGNFDSPNGLGLGNGKFTGNLTVDGTISGSLSGGSVSATTGTFSGDVTTGPNLYIGTSDDSTTPKSIFFGGTYGDNYYNHCVIERRIWEASSEKQELLLFSGNDPETTAGPDRIRLRGAQILFDTYSDVSTDRAAESIRMIIRAGGNVGIGTSDPSYKLHVSGDIYATGDVIMFSDERKKTNIEGIPNALEKVLQLRGVTFNKLDDDDDRRHAGVIAQEVEKVLPEVVYTDEHGTKSVAYGNMIGLLIEAIKELAKK